MEFQFFLKIQMNLQQFDIGLVAGEDAHGDEKKVNIIAKDSRSPYDYTLRKKLQEAADKNKIQYTIGVHNRYGSDATTAILQDSILNMLVQDQMQMQLITMKMS